ncbi:MAG TPA: glycosyltransferase family 4 protein [Vicinamibacteria bacterium]|nr:glycosyltransferase family 4 protein [Vicinamibacteria bacterium]
MRILMIAPEPFFQPRGTPFSEYYRARAMTELGHTVDVVTYPMGEDVDMPGLTVYRAPRIPGLKNVRVGPSGAKLALDALVFTSSIRRLLAARYDLLDCHEEAGLIGVVLAKLFRVPTIYDMHSSLPEQLENFDYTRNGLVRRLFEVGERLTIRGSDGVIVICPYLESVVSRVDGNKPCFLIENTPLAEAGETVPPEAVEALRERLGLANAFVILYTGTFEAYQGLPLLYRAFRQVQAKAPQARLVLVGGQAEQLVAAENELRALGVLSGVVFTGQRPPSEMPRYWAVGDVLASPRSQGNNTPLKIYSYLRAGKPIVATRLVTHTQVLDDDCAVLTEPTPEAFAEGILTLASDSARRRELGLAAFRRSERDYSYERYVERTRRVLDFVSELSSGSVARARAATTD